MSSHLETVPHDVLQHIAFQCAASSVFEPPVEVLRLMQTCSGVYDSLNTYAAPHLYAQIFVSKFDTSAPFRRYRSTITDSALTTELVSRCRLLQRVHRRDFSPAGLMQDMWTALWMVLESDGLNEMHLSKSKFVDFIWAAARICLQPVAPADQLIGATSLKHVVVWLLCVTFPRRIFLDMSTRDRDDLYSLIFPYIFLPNMKLESSVLGVPSVLGSSTPIDLSGGPPEDALVSTYLRQQLPRLPDPSLAAINLAYAIFEATPLKVPPHLPETRAIAIAGQRTGPTKEDYRTLGSYRTPLFSDYMPLTLGSGADIPETMPGEETSPELARSMLHDMEFDDILSRPAANGASTSEAFAYRPGTMTGLWEGNYRTVPSPAGASQDTENHTVASMVLVKPLQCALTEFICEEGPKLEDDILDVDLCSADFVDVRDVSELCLNGQMFRRYEPQWSAAPPNSGSVASDVLLLGETLEDHDQAWGAFRFSGKIHRDGRVVLIRKPKNDNGEWPGVWIFEGRLRFGKVLLGHWRITGASDSLAHGVFSLGKTHER